MHETASTVYVVDDDASVREALSSLMRSAGLRVQTFVSAAEVLRRFQTELPDCLILDVHLPDLNGLELQARVAETHPEVPIIFLTGGGDIPTSVRAIKAGAVEFLTKPLVDDSVLTAVRQGIAQASRRRQVSAPAIPRVGRFEHYEVLRRPDGSLWELGRGAMGVTYKALDTRLHHHVALKVIPVDLTNQPGTRERFLREARIAARLRHPNVASVFHLGEPTGGNEAFYAMEFIEGETLEARVRGTGPLSVFLAVEVGMEVARALAAAYQQGLIHRDLKPANLMLVARAEAATLAAAGSDSHHAEVPDAWVKVIDFGLAKAVAEAGPLTGVGDFLGTPQYASPEQFAGDARAVDSRSDVYSLGGVLWFALTASMPFTARSFTEMHAQKRVRNLPTEQLAAFAVPAPLVRLLTSMLATDPGDRPQTPAALLDAMRRCREELFALSLRPGGRSTEELHPWLPLGRFKRRRIYQVSIGYAIVAWLVLQVAAIVLPALEWPHWIMRPVIVTLVAGFGEALLLGWALERRAAGMALLPRSPARRLGLILAALAPACLLAAFFFWQPKSIVSPEKILSAPADPPTSIAETPVSPKSIAVLPFANFSDDRQETYFADGVQDEIITDLAKIADLKVISRTSVMQYKEAGSRNLREIGRQLGVAYLLEGSVQRAGNQVRVNAQLIDARTDAHQWAELYDRPLDNVFAIQSEIAKTIANQLRAKLLPGEQQAIARVPTNDVSAFDLYSQAKTILLTAKGDNHAEWRIRQAIDLLNQALARDPAFLQAVCELAGAHDYFYAIGYDHTPQRLALADAAVQMALRLHPEAGESHLARAFHLEQGYHDHDGALAELETVRRLLPNNARVPLLTGLIQRRRGEWEPCLRSFEGALELDPRNFSLLEQAALSYSDLRRYREAKEMLSRALMVRPEDDNIMAVRAAFDIDWKADPQPLHQVIDAIRARNPAALLEVADMWLIGSLAERDAPAAERALTALGDQSFGFVNLHLSHAFGEGLVGRMTNDPAKAREAFMAARVAQEALVQAQPDYGPPLAVLGLIDAGLGRKEDALREARRAVELTPVGKDAANGAIMLEFLAITAAWVGDKNLACEQLALAARLPGTVSYGALKLLPYWDPLRGDPRFGKIVATLAPKP